jgi:transposase InsO family protein
MSKARLVITAVTVEKRSVSEVARTYGVARSWIYKLLARYEAEGEAAFEPRSRRPKTSPAAISEDTVELIVWLRKELSGQGLDAGPHTIAWHLEHHHQIRVSAATISRYLTRQGLVTPEPKKRPRSSYLRFAAELPNQLWQSDFIHWQLAGGTETEIVSWIDDHSRYALSVTAHPVTTGQVTLATFRAACARYGIPASTLTDNGLVYTTRLAGGRGGRNGLEHELRALGVTQKNGRPGHPQTQGKVERFQQTLQKWLAARPAAATLTDLQAQLDAFTEAYNTRRPHRSLEHRATPAVAYAARPKAAPGDRTTDTHDRVRADIIGDTGTVTLRHAGRLHHIGVGRTHARTRVLLLIRDLDIRIINAATGELLRQLTLDPARNYQPTRRPPGPTKTTPRKRPNPEP